MSSKLEEIAAIQRAAITNPNNYRHSWSSQDDTNNQYSPTHTRAMADEKTPIYGKGTGEFLDTNNYNAGGEYDKHGNPAIIGSGRINSLNLNQAKWGYGPTSEYKRPDTSTNYGQYNTP